MVDLALLAGIEKVLSNTLATHGLQCEGRDESRGRGRQDATHLMACSAQRTDQLGRLVGRDPT
jgi:hypothetical protein